MRHEAIRLRPAILGAGRSCALHLVPCLPEPERVVALGFRYWMLGLTHGGVADWQRAWCLYSGLFGAVSGSVATDDLATWVELVAAAPAREIEVFPHGCSSFSRDECTAVALIAACQHRAAATARAAAAALVEPSFRDGLTAPARRFAETLLSLDLRLSAASIARSTLQ